MTARATNTSAQASRHDVAVRFLAAATLVLTRSRRNGRSFRRSKFAAATATRRKPPIILDHTDDGGCGDYDAWFMSGQLRASSVFVTGFGVAAVLGVVVALAAPAVSDASVKRRDPCYPRTRGRALPRLLRDSFVRCVRRELHTSEVNRLTADLAQLRDKLANERKHLADANAKALKAVEALAKATTTSQLGSRGRDVERHQKAAAGYEKKTADLEKKIAVKQRALSSAQGKLERARGDQQKRDDQETDKRRKADLEHIKTLERARRRSTQLPDVLEPRVPLVLPLRPSPSGFTETFDVCLSFAGATRLRGANRGGAEGCRPESLLRPRQGHCHPALGAGSGGGT